MRRAWATCVLTALVAAAVGIGAPAAQASEDCVPEDIQSPPGFTVVSVNGLDVEVHPDGLVADAGAWRAYLTMYVLGPILCLEGGTVTGTVSCARAKVEEILADISLTAPDLRYVYFTETGGVGFRGNLLLADATACLPV